MPRSIARYLDCVDRSTRRAVRVAAVATSLSGLRNDCRAAAARQRPVVAVRTPSCRPRNAVGHTARRPARTDRVHRWIRAAEGRAAAARATRRDSDRPRIRTRRRADSGDRRAEGRVRALRPRRLSRVVSAARQARSHRVEAPLQTSRSAEDALHRTRSAPADVSRRHRLRSADRQSAVSGGRRDRVY